MILAARVAVENGIYSSGWMAGTRSLQPGYWAPAADGWVRMFAPR